jgi:hypothetical protein
LAGVENLPFGGFSTRAEGIGLRRRNFFLSFKIFGRSLVVLGISSSPFLHNTLVSVLGDGDTGGRLGAEMAWLVASDREVRDTGEGRSSA